MANKGGIRRLQIRPTRTLSRKKEERREIRSAHLAYPVTVQELAWWYGKETKTIRSMVSRIRMGHRIRKLKAINRREIQKRQFERVQMEKMAESPVHTELLFSFKEPEVLCETYGISRRDLEKIAQKLFSKRKKLRFISPEKINAIVRALEHTRNTIPQIARAFKVTLADVISINARFQPDRPYVRAPKTGKNIYPSTLDKYLLTTNSLDEISRKTGTPTDALQQRAHVLYQKRKKAGRITAEDIQRVHLELESAENDFAGIAVKCKVTLADVIGVNTEYRIRKYHRDKFSYYVHFTPDQKKWILEKLLTTNWQFNRIAREFIKKFKIHYGLYGIRGQITALNAEAQIRSADDIKRIAYKHRKYLNPKNLPVLNLLSRAEKEKILREYEPELKKYLQRYKQRGDREDIAQSVRLYLWEALDKWDKKRHLPLFLSDAKEWGLIEYFVLEKPHTKGRTDLDVEDAEAISRMEGTRWRKTRDRREDY